jgi:type VI secretion system secreted protein VgrG
MVTAAVAAGAQAATAAASSMRRADPTVQSGGSSSGGGSGSGSSSSGSSSGSSGSAGSSSSAGGMAARAVQAAFNGEETEQVTYLFECPGSDVPWTVLETQAEEHISGCYKATVQLRTRDMSAEGGQLLGQSCTLLMERGVVQHRLSGIVAEVRAGDLDNEHVLVTVGIVPALWALKQRRNSRIFQDMTVPDILRTGLTEGLDPYERSLQFELENGYLGCEYRVQFDETDFDFVSRLMQEEGIAYWFDQEGETEVMVLADVAAKYRELLTLHDRALDFVSHNNAVGGHESVVAFQMLSTLQPTAVLTHHFDWTHPGTPVKGSVVAEPVEGEPVHGGSVGPLRELYEQDNRPLVFSAYDESSGYQKSDVNVQSTLRHAAHQQQAHIAHGQSTAIGMMPGVAFDLIGHPLPELDGRYVVLSVTHRGRERGGQRGSRGSANEGYSNSFTCMRADIMYRPPRTLPKPRLPGLQTATVVGPNGQEIHTDKHGRIRVQFHWDREGGFNEHSSCYVRVMQAWAGAGWGFVFIPRIGMEVTVAFVNGDADQPLVTGSVYNMDNPPPYGLPDEMTKSTIKTRSSPTPADEQEFGYNELTFEDKKGGEQIIIHAQKDFVETVENDHTTTVHGNSANSVDGGHSESVGGDASLSVKGERTVTVTGEQKINVESNQTVTVDKDHTLDVKHNILVKAPDSITLECGDSKIEMVPGKITISTAGSNTTRAATS